MMIEIVDGFWIDVWKARAIRKVDDDTCLLYMAGQGAMDGHLLEFPADEVADLINDEQEKQEQGDDEPKPDPDPNVEG